jgi:hypothetical protein
VLLRGKRAAQGGGRPDGSPRKYALQLFPILWCRRRQHSLRALAYTIAYRPCAPRLLTLWASAGPGAQGQ